MEGIVVGEYTVTAANDAGDEVALLIGIGYALTVDDSLGRRGKLRPHDVERLLYLHHLVEGDRSTGVAFYAAGTVTGGEVAAELFCQQVA